MTAPPAPTLRRHPRFPSAFLTRARDIVVYLPPGYDTGDAVSGALPARRPEPLRAAAGARARPALARRRDRRRTDRRRHASAHHRRRHRQHRHVAHPGVHAHTRCADRRRTRRRLRALPRRGAEAVHRSYLPDPARPGGHRPRWIVAGWPRHAARRPDAAWRVRRPGRDVAVGVVGSPRDPVHCAAHPAAACRAASGWTWAPPRAVARWTMRGC